MTAELDSFNQRFPDGFLPGISVLHNGTDDCAFVYVGSTHQFIVIEHGVVAPYTGEDCYQDIDGEQVIGDREYVILQNGVLYRTDFEEAGESIILGLVGAVDGIVHETVTSWGRRYARYIAARVLDDVSKFEHPSDSKDVLLGLSQYTKVIAHVELT